MPETVSIREPLFTPKFIGLWVYAFVTFFSAFQLLPTIPLHILEIGGSKAQAGWFLAVYTYASAFAAPLMGNLADHLGRRRTLITASILFIAFSIAYGLINYLPLLLIVGAIHGAIWSGILSSSSAIMAGIIPESRRVQGWAYWGLAGNGAISLAPAVGLWVFHHGGWRTVCFEMAGLSVLMTIGALLIRMRDKRPTFADVRLHDAWDWNVIGVTFSLTMIAIGYGGITSYAVILSKERSISPEGLYLSTFAAAVVLVRIATGHLGDRYGAKAILVPSLSLVPIALAILAFAQNRWELMTSAILFGFGFGAAWPAFAAFILANSDPARRARTFGSMVWAFDTGIGTGSLALGSLSQHYDFRIAFLFATAVACFSIPLFIAGSRRLTSRVLPSGA
jgi:MFS family permease